MIAKHPVLSVGVALGLGYLFAKKMYSKKFYSKRCVFEKILDDNIRGNIFGEMYILKKYIQVECQLLDALNICRYAVFVTLGKHVGGFTAEQWHSESRIRVEVGQRAVGCSRKAPDLDHKVVALAFFV